jgi:hypothetical protein
MDHADYISFRLWIATVADELLMQTFDHHCANVTSVAIESPLSTTERHLLSPLTRLSLRLRASYGDDEHSTVFPL